MLCVATFCLMPAAALHRSAGALVVGGSGRVGGSTVRWLYELSRRDGSDGLPVAVGGQSAASFVAAQRRLSEKGVPAAELQFVPMDVEASVDTLRAVVRGRAIVVHTAGPFQGRRDPVLLAACIAEGVPYVDVCDEWHLAQQAKTSLHQPAIDKATTAVTAAGIWPGTSALMAAEAVSKLGSGGCEKLDLSFFTAGTGNAGPTIVSATFLLLCQDALTYFGGREARTNRATQFRSRRREGVM
jgi:saccharopine dehydrogenase-like NADP-dependent oxidoreductase